MSRPCSGEHRSSRTGQEPWGFPMNLFLEKFVLPCLASVVASILAGIVTTYVANRQSLNPKQRTLFVVPLVLTFGIGAFYVVTLLNPKAGVTMNASTEVGNKANGTGVATALTPNDQIDKGPGPVAVT